MLAFVGRRHPDALIGTCYAELASRLPRRAANFSYALEGWGPNTASSSAGSLPCSWWSCAPSKHGACVDGRLAVPAAKGPVLYRLLGEPVTLDGLVLGLGGAAVICALNLSGLRASVLFQMPIRANQGSP